MLNENKPEALFQGKVRVRVCGILTEESRILLLKHENLGPAGFLWSPPGGGVEFGDSLHETFVREFKEETNLDVSVGLYLFTNEYIDKKYHAIELFFEVTRVGGQLKLGHDPELPLANQMLSEARFFTKEELLKLPQNVLHNAFSNTNKQNTINELEGLITFKC